MGLGFRVDSGVSLVGRWVNSAQSDSCCSATRVLRDDTLDLDTAVDDDDDDDDDDEYTYIYIYIHKCMYIYTHIGPASPIIRNTP